MFGTYYIVFGSFLKKFFCTIFHRFIKCKNISPCFFSFQYDRLLLIVDLIDNILFCHIF